MWIGLGLNVLVAAQACMYVWEEKEDVSVCLFRFWAGVGLSVSLH